MGNLGFLAALGAALAWGTYMVPFKKSKSENLIGYQAIMTAAIGFSGLIFSLLFGYSLNFNLAALLSGFLWALANSISLIALKNLGLSIATPVLSSIVIITSFIWGAVVFREISAFLTGFLALGLIIAGVVLVSMTGNMEGGSKRKGFMAGILAGLIFGSQLVPLKIFNLSIHDFFFPLCTGIFLSGLLIAVFNRVKFEKAGSKEAVLTGFIWNVGNILSLISLSIIGLAKMGPISQSSVLVAVLWGVFYFKEITEKRLKIQILIGAIILLGGVLTLGLA